MSDLNNVSSTNQNSTHDVSGGYQDQKDNNCVSPDVRHMKGGEGEPRAKRKLRDLAQDFDRTNEQYDHERKDPKRAFCPSDAPTLVQARSTSYQSNDICDDCRNLNLDVLIREVQKPKFHFAQKQYATPWERIESGTWLRAGVGWRYRRRQYACSLCRAVAATRIALETRSSTGEAENQDHGDEIRVEHYSKNWGFTKNSGKARKQAVHLFLIRQGSPVDRRILSDHIDLGGSLILFDSSTDPEIFEPQPISPSFDPSLVLSWLDYCTRYHRMLCHSEPLPVHGVKVIDCNTLQIKDHHANMHYVSLSYVWGKSKNVCEPVETIGGQKTLPQLLPPLIRDSIQVTIALGYQYLWIDKFCIDQDTAELKHDQIQQMDAIYKNSQLTIIGAAGQDESYGLPGVGIRDRSHQFIVELDGATVLWNPNDPHLAISRSRWSTRGWTFQEALLSRRRLVFTDDQVYFQCNTMNCFESHHCALDKLHVKNRSKTLEAVRSGIFGQNKYRSHGNLVRDKETLKESFGRYLSNVDEYTSRKLSFEEDSLNAFQGIIRQFSREKYAFDHVWGLAFPSNCKESLNLFVYSLTWMHRVAVKTDRRRSFPSWTWAGWEGHVKYHFRIGTTTNFVNGLHDLRFRTTADEALALEELGEDRNLAVLRITATVVSLGTDAYSGAQEEWRISNHRATLSWSDSDQTSDQLVRMFEDTSRWQFVYIGSLSANPWSFVMILGLGENGRTWRRAGMFLVHASGRIFKNKKDVGEQISTYEIE